MISRTKLLIAQPDAAKLVSLILWMEQFTDIEVVGTTRSGDKLVHCVASHQPDVVLLDFSLSAGNAAAAVRRIKGVSSTPAILVMHESDIAPMESALGKDLDGYINPKISLTELTDSVRMAAQRRVEAGVNAYIPAALAG
jgi:DNA-binding NarL/FixJ family response regulator